MKVRELIEELKKQDQERAVNLYLSDNEDDKCFLTAVEAVGVLDYYNILVIKGF